MNDQSLGSCKPDLRLTVDQAIETLRQWAAEAFLNGDDVKAKALRDAAYNLRSLEIERRKANNR